MLMGDVEKEWAFLREVNPVSQAEKNDEEEIEASCTYLERRLRYR